jgi:AraC-like DNA-binding protein
MAMNHNDCGAVAESPLRIALQIELAERVARSVPADGMHRTNVPKLWLSRATEESQCVPALMDPSLFVVVQGRKRVLVGEREFVYDPFTYVVVTVPMPVRSHVIEASPDDPFLCLRVEIDPKTMGELLLEVGPIERPDDCCECGVYCDRASDALLEGVLRLVRLLDAPAEVPVLAPLALREIYYRLLASPQGLRLRELSQVDSQAQRIARAIELLKSRYNEPLRIAELAEAVHMSPSALHHRFKAVTAMSPIQFQKQLRLHEARRLMVIEGLEAASAGHRVGYESPSQFSREYRRLFGAPPRQDISHLLVSGASRSPALPGM